MGGGGGGGLRYGGRRSGDVGVMRVVVGSYRRKEKVRKMNVVGKMAGMSLRKLR